MAGVLFFCLSCKEQLPTKPLTVKHKFSADTLKVLVKGSPPFEIKLSKENNEKYREELNTNGVARIRLDSLRMDFGEYLLSVLSSSGDTTITVNIDKAAPIAKKESASIRPQNTRREKSVVSKEWGKWERSECYREIWYRYRIYRVLEDHGLYRYEYQVYNGYDVKVIVSCELIESTDKAQILKKKASGADFFGMAKEHHLKAKDYSANMRVSLTSPSPYLFTWRLQSPNPVSPYIDCDR